MEVSAANIEGKRVITEIHLTRDDFVIHRSQQIHEDSDRSARAGGGCDYRLMSEHTTISLSDEHVQNLLSKIGCNYSLRTLLGQFPGETPLSGDVVMHERTQGPLMIGNIAKLSEDAYQESINELRSHFKMMEERFIESIINEIIDGIQMRLVSINRDLLRDLAGSGQLIDNLQVDDRILYNDAKNQLQAAQIHLEKAQVEYADTVYRLFTESTTGNEDIPRGIYLQYLNMMKLGFTPAPENGIAPGCEFKNRLKLLSE